MKTIEERAEYYAETVGRDRYQGDGDASYDDFVAGAKSEHEELTRWNSPECPPDNDRDVLLKIRNADKILPETCFFAVGFYSGTKFHISLVRHIPIDVVGWREIHE